MTFTINLGSLLYNCPVIDSFLSFVFDWLWILSVSLSISVQPLTVLVDCWSKIEEFPNQMAIFLSEFQRQILLSEKTDLLQCLSSEFKITLFRFRCLLISSSLSLILSSKVPLTSTVPLGRPPSNSFIHSLYAFCPRHNTRRRSLSMLVLSHSDTHTTAMGIWNGTGATKVVTSPAAHRGIWHSAGATKSWLHWPMRSKSFAVIEKSLNSTEIFYLDGKRNAQGWQSNTN